MLTRDVSARITTDEVLDKYLRHNEIRRRTYDCILFSLLGSHVCSYCGTGFFVAILSN
uniref:Uncharacterized protein n=1 Tax=Populus trichocarpa TaxID=3694 RepID=A0A2K2BGL3_POPTR